MRRNLAGVLLVVLGVLGVVAPASAGTDNTGTTGSACSSSDGGLSFVSPGVGVSATRLGADAPAYYEVGSPSGEFTGRRAKAIMIVIHGGGWYTVGKALVSASRNQADRWRDAGWTTVNIDYRACGKSIGDVLWFMSRIRARNPSAIVCATGRSAGGQLVLLLAGVRRDLACATSGAGPSDLVALNGQLATDRLTGLPNSAGPDKLSNLAVAAFGTKPSPLLYYNPMRYADRVTARLLLATGAGDILVPAMQDTSFATAVLVGHPGNYVDVMSLPKGTSLFVHALVTPQSLAELHNREDALVAPLFL